jgi:alkanesulfonate monooxygenase SsuD/methylene tetrahydromethanopterin reductase-like flavin-dependent oxidoreductase (luciferase family)
MAGRVEFGWRVADFPTDGSDSKTFLNQITETLDLIHGRFDAAWVADHVIPWASWLPPETPAIECWTTLTFLAARYPELVWGPIVLCQSNRNPALLAKMVANFCALLPGKFVFGIGAGWKEDEYRSYNWEFPKPSVRIAQLEETVEIAKLMWREDDATYEGKQYQIHNAYLDPKPDPIPPILIGGSGEQLTLRVVAKHADWWNGGGTPESYAHKLDVLRGHCEAVGRDFGTIKRTVGVDAVAIADSEAEARRMAEASPFFNGSGLIGTPEQIVAQIQQWMDLGVSHFHLRFADFPRTDGIRHFMDEVMPKFR